MKSWKTVREWDTRPHNVMLPPQPSQWTLCYRKGVGERGKTPFPISSWIQTLPVAQSAGWFSFLSRLQWGNPGQGSAQGTLSHLLRKFNQAQYDPLSSACFILRKIKTSLKRRLKNRHPTRACNHPHHSTKCNHHMGNERVTAETICSSALVDKGRICLWDAAPLPGWGAISLSLSRLSLSLGRELNLGVSNSSSGEPGDKVCASRSPLLSFTINRQPRATTIVPQSH